MALYKVYGRVEATVAIEVEADSEDEALDFAEEFTDFDYIEFDTYPDWIEAEVCDEEV